MLGGDDVGVGYETAAGRKQDPEPGQVRSVVESPPWLPGAPGRRAGQLGRRLKSALRPDLTAEDLGEG
jgi:hypothetical protein